MAASVFSRFRRESRSGAKASDSGEQVGPAPVADLTDGDFFDSLDGHATIVDFWAPWCGPCKALHPLFDELAHTHADEGLHFARLNVDESRTVAPALGIMSIPTLMLCDLKGNEVDRLVGMPDRRRLEELIARAKGLTG
ncbi:MAG: thioredoxin fold domain-containing protein [Actinobacteria bacterium]|jgi:thioredoxin 1|nr:thioredoxin fold domain-containing protein [Actinomycetota bacterium]MBT3686554.1 thioredoxin fold domain-containing protein [Actinomycetota bacterium]MBT4038358.1 thioredoxin fold domain-containing protein [Actinomycetota bacterium]MBT4279452.1 thioredoxin fold domain-containing protein [Actinomycetota bacterium]MBT4343594.1 thioredoxin fold domain-containing protein [Actinomycetota bacterium]